MWTYSHPFLPCSRRSWRLPVTRWPERSIRPSFLTSTWRSSPARDREAKSPQLHNHRDPLLSSATGDPPRRRRAVAQASLALEPITSNPLPCAADADTSRCSSRHHRPPLIDNELAEPTTTRPAESGVSVQNHHPVTSLEPSLPLTALSLQGGPDEPTSSGTTARRPTRPWRRAPLSKNRSPTSSLYMPIEW
jgi:hypothetical protein